MCKKCTPSQQPMVLCSNPGDITEVNCDNETQPASGAMFDSCTVAKVATNLGTTYPMECAVKVSCNLVPRAHSAFKMAGGETLDKTAIIRQESWIILLRET